MAQPKLPAILIVTLTLLAGCSSAPPPPDGVQTQKNRASDYLRFGKQAFQAAQYDQALTFYQNALDLDTSVDYEAGMAAAWNSVATAQTALGRLDDARTSLVQAEEYAAQSGDRTLVLQVAVNLIQADLATGNSDGAQKRLEALQPFPMTAEGAALNHTEGLLKKELGRSAEALAAFDQALAVNQSLGLKQEMAGNHFMKGMVYGHDGNWSAAQKELTTALGLDRFMENTVGIAQDWRALGTVDLKLGDLKGGFDAYVRASRIFQAAGLLVQQKKTVDLILPLTVTLGLPDEKARYQAILDRLTANNK